MAGVYKHRCENGGFDGPDEPRGEIHGIATDVAPAALVHDNGGSGDQRCVLKLVWTAPAVINHAGCHRTPPDAATATAGMRGSPDHAGFAQSQRQVIRHMERLKNSAELKEAWAEYAGRAPAR